MASKKATKKVATRSAAASKALPASKSATKYDSTISKTSAYKKIMENGGGKIFSVVCNTKNTEGRKLTGRLQAPSKVKGTGKATNVAALGMLRIYDMVEHGWKTINLQTMSALKIGGKSYRVK
jgi:hypothetical protein